MRLVNTTTLQLKSFTSNIPRYAILSHTWGTDEEEVTFQEMVVGQPSKDTVLKSGYAKILKTCEIAREQYSLGWVWVDTACIDKSSSAELSEAINSMYKWYQDATICFAFLYDLKSGFSSFSGCKWFTRGWCLQELIAPKEIIFFDQRWTYRGKKSELMQSIFIQTGISLEVLSNPSLHLHTIPVAVRMSWAAYRKTTRVEDMAYSLMGIFDINMPLLYGEGNKAFVRLQEEIIKQTPDLSIFYWLKHSRNNSFSGLLAQSPSYFKHIGALSHQPDIMVSHREFSITNQGVRFMFPVGKDPFTGCFILPVGHRRQSDGPLALGVILRQVGIDIFIRYRPDMIYPVGRYVQETSLQVPKFLSARQVTLAENTQLQVIDPTKFGHTDFHLIEVEPKACFDPTAQTIHAGHMRTLLGYLRFEPAWADRYDYYVVVFGFEEPIGDYGGWACILLRGKEWPDIKRIFFEHFRNRLGEFCGIGNDMQLELPATFSSLTKIVSLSLTACSPASIDFPRRGANLKLCVSSNTEGNQSTEYV